MQQRDELMALEARLRAALEKDDAPALSDADVDRLLTLRAQQAAADAEVRRERRDVAAHRAARRALRGHRLIAEALRDACRQS